MSTNNGVARFNPPSRTFQNYSTADGLPGPDLTGWGACAKSAAGEMFFGGFSGATAFFPDRVTESAHAAPVVLTDFRLFGLPVHLKGGSPLTKAINYTDAVTLSHDQNIFSIGFSALSYRNPATNRYRYMLEGFDPQWNEVGSDERRASYTMLPAGTYTLHVQAATGRGAWSEPGARLRIDVLPPWWRTAWFGRRTSSLLLLAGVAAYYTACGRSKRPCATASTNGWRSARASRESSTTRSSRPSRQQAGRGRRTRPLRRCGPDARGPWNACRGWLEQATREGRTALNSLRTSTTQRNDLAEALRRATENSGHPSSMTVALSVIGEAREMHPIVRDEVYRIGYEAIRNAYKHSNGSRLTVGLTYAQDLTLRVADNGIGIEPADRGQGEGRTLRAAGDAGAGGPHRGNLTLVSSLASGTEIKLVVPGRIIFRKQGSARPSQGARLRALIGRKRRQSPLD